MSEQIEETGAAVNAFDWAANIQDAHEYLDKIDLTAVNQSYGLRNDRRAEIITVTIQSGNSVQVIRERFGSPEGQGRRRDIYYYLGEQASGQEALLVMQDHSLEHEMHMIDIGEVGRITDVHRSRATRVTEGPSTDLEYPEVTAGTESEMHRFLQTLSGIVTAQRTTSKAA